MGPQAHRARRLGPGSAPLTRPPTHAEVVPFSPLPGLWIAIATLVTAVTGLIVVLGKLNIGSDGGQPAAHLTIKQRVTHGGLPSDQETPIDDL